MKNIFVIALDDLNRELFKTIRHADSYRFHSLFAPEEIVAAPRYAMAELLEKARKELDDFPESIHAIVSFWDFPTTLMLPTLRRMAGLQSTSTESILRCVHKYWSRLVQQSVVPDMIPRFAAFNPYADTPLQQVDLDFPFWIKPVKAHSSILGFRIEGAEDFEAALPQIRHQIKRFTEPFNYLLERADVPADVARVDGSYCIAESIISAQNQCTLEGYVFNGVPKVYGIVDSLREEHPSSFSRYHYPSRLPDGIQRRMIEATEVVMREIGLDNEPFNIEFYHDPETDHIALLEINPRISKSHCPLFYLVEGASHQEVMIEVALHKQPDYPPGERRYPMATKFMLRRYTGDALVKRVPSTDEIDALKRDVDGVMIMVWAKAGSRLSDFADQDSYSYEYANLFIGGESEEELQDKYRRCMDQLKFEFEPSS